MWSHHRWTHAGFVLVVLVALGLTWAALGDFSRATDAAPPHATCGCGQADAAVMPHVTAAGDVDIRVDLPSNVSALEEGATFQVAIPTNVTIDVGSDLDIVTGKGTGISPVNCAPGTPQPHSAVIVDPGGGSAAQHSGILIYADEPIPSGTRLRITSGPHACNGELTLYDGTVE